MSDRVKRRRILALPTGERELTYPAFQFSPTGEPYRAMASVLELFSTAKLSPHTIASWFVTPQASLDDATPAEWMAEDRDTERLLVAARRSAARTAPTDGSPVLGSPPGDLRRFPRRTRRSTVDLFRIHPAYLQPWWFSSDGHGRFDLTPPAGTCYLAASPLGAFVEVFRDFALIDAEDVAARKVSRLRLPAGIVLADFASSRARAFGVTAAIHGMPDYVATQAWAVALRQTQFGGVRYLCGHDPSQREVGFAIFGVPGAAEWPVEDSSPISEEVVRSVAGRFGLHVLPAPGRDGR